MTAIDPITVRPGGALRRIAALIRKETYQLLRDPSSIAIGIVMPLLLLVLFGYGLNLDVKNVPMATVVQNTVEPSPLANFGSGPKRRSFGSSQYSAISNGAEKYLK